MEQNQNTMSLQTQQMLRWFAYSHLPGELQEVSRTFHDVAHHLAQSLVDSAERSATLRKLLEAKDCAVRAKILGLPQG